LTANRFKAFRVFEENGAIAGRVVETTLDELDPGSVVIHAECSSVNYKDALAATGAGKIMRRFPLIGGVDVAGVVAESSDPRFRPGLPVLVTGYDLGVAHDGGYAEYVRVPADWVVPIPEGLAPVDVMTIGTAGFTAALSVIEMERNGLSPERGPVIVAGATGGVGSIAVECLSARGYAVTALTGKAQAEEFLRTLGAKTSSREVCCRWGRGHSRRRRGQAPSTRSAERSSPGSPERWRTAAASRARV